MSHWNADEIRDIFNFESSSVNHFLPCQDGENAIELVTLSDSHKNPRFEAFDAVGASLQHEDPEDEFVPFKIGLPLPYFNEGSCNINDTWSLLPEKAAPALGITKFTAGSNKLVNQEEKISTTFKECVNGTGNTTICIDDPSSRKRGAKAKEKLGHIFSADALGGVLEKEERNANNDLIFYDCPNIGDFEEFDRMFRNIDSTIAQGSSVTNDETSWFSSSSHGFHGVEDTLQSVVLSSVSELSALNASGSQGLSTNALPAIAPSSIDNEMPFSTGCSSFPLYSDAERKGKSVVSELAHDNSELASKSWKLEQIGYENVCSEPNMMNNVLAMQYVPPAQTTLDTFAIDSSAFPLCGISDNSSIHTPQTMGIPPGLFSIVSAVPVQKADKQYVHQQLSATLVVSQPLGQHATASSSFVQRRYRFKDEVGGDKEPAHTNLTLPAVSRCSSSHDNSFVSSYLNNASLIAASFQQLQMIMDQLGGSIKLCMRDSFYRLARSAEQRHNYGTVNNVTSESNPMEGLQGAKEPKRPPEFVGTSDTNVIERAVAYLLFHRSLDSGSRNVVDDDALWFTPPGPMI